jgi:hypothetical protein
VSPTIADIAAATGCDPDALCEIVADLRDRRELASVLWDEISPEHDLAGEDVPAVLMAVIRSRMPGLAAYEEAEYSQTGGNPTRVVGFVLAGVPISMTLGVTP